MLDLFFHYKFVGRNLLINRYFNLMYNSYELWKINYLIIFFSINDLVDFDNTEALNYAYLIKFFFGRKCFISNYKCVFNRGIYYYSFIIQSLIKKLDLYFVLFFYINDIKPVLNFDLIEVKSMNSFLLITVKDMHIFVEKKNNIGLFNLVNCLNLKICYPDFWYIEQNSMDIFKIYIN